MIRQLRQEGHRARGCPWCLGNLTASTRRATQDDVHDLSAEAVDEREPEPRDDFDADERDHLAEAVLCELYGACSEHAGVRYDATPLTAPLGDVARAA